MMKKILTNISLLSVVFSFQAAMAAGGGGGGGSGSDPCTGLTVVAESALIDMNTQSGVAQNITVSRASGTTGTCEYFIVIDWGSSGSSYLTRYLTHGSDLLGIQFYKEVAKTNIIRSITEATATTMVISDKLNGSGTSKSHVYIPALGSTSVPSGPYTGGFTFSIYKWDGSSFTGATYYDQKSVNYKYTKSGEVSLSLVDTGSAYNAADINQTMDFGSLTTGEFQSFDAVLMYNEGYTLSMSSVNAGKIKNTNGTLTANNTVPYTLTLDSTPVTLSSAYQQVKAGTGASPSTGTRLPITVTIGTVGGVHPGTYTDTVSIKIATP